MILEILISGYSDSTRLQTLCKLLASKYGLESDLKKNKNKMKNDPDATFFLIRIRIRNPHYSGLIKAEREKSALKLCFVHGFKASIMAGLKRSPKKIATINTEEEQKTTPHKYIAGIFFVSHK